VTDVILSNSYTLVLWAIEDAHIKFGVCADIGVDGKNIQACLKNEQPTIRFDG
jgi:hypothetical protein